MCAFWFCLLLLGTTLPGLPLVMMGGNFRSGFWDKLENERTSNGTNGRLPVLAPSVREIGGWSSVRDGRGVGGRAACRIAGQAGLKMRGVTDGYR